MSQVIAEISARHIHLSQADLDTLFGAGFVLEKYKELSQPGEFASQSTLEVVGPKNTIKSMRIVGPVRAQTQVELAVSDCVYLGVQPIFRLSGHLEHSGGGLTLVGPQGKLELNSGVIVPIRHMHTSVKDAGDWHLQTGDKVKARVGGERGLVLENIIVRVGDFDTRVHLDTDEANAAGLLACSKIDLEI